MVWWSTILGAGYCMDCGELYLSCHARAIVTVPSPFQRDRVFAYIACGSQERRNNTNTSLSET